MKNQRLSSEKVWSKAIEGGVSESKVSFLLLIINNQLIINKINFFYKSWPKVIEGGEFESAVSFSKFILVSFF